MTTKYLAMSETQTAGRLPRAHQTRGTSRQIDFFGVRSRRRRYMEGSSSSPIYPGHPGQKLSDYHGNEAAEHRRVNDSRKPSTCSPITIGIPPRRRCRGRPDRVDNARRYGRGSRARTDRRHGALHGGVGSSRQYALPAYDGLAEFQEPHRLAHNLRVYRAAIGAISNPSDRHSRIWCASGLLLPMLAGTGGNSGSQSAAIIVRAIILKESCRGRLQGTLEGNEKSPFSGLGVGFLAFVRSCSPPQPSRYQARSRSWTSVWR